MRFPPFSPRAAIGIAAALVVFFAGFVGALAVLSALLPPTPFVEIPETGATAKAVWSGWSLLDGIRDSLPSGAVGGALYIGASLTASAVGFPFSRKPATRPDGGLPPAAPC